MRELDPVQTYAVKLVVDGARSHAEDDMNEDGDVPEADHEQAVKLALLLTRVVSAYPHVLLELAGGLK